MSFFSRFSLSIPTHRRFLSWKLPEGKIGKFQVKAAALTIGRQAPNDIVIAHETISRRHARLTLEQDQLFVEDLASTRGTWVGEERVRPYTRTLVPPDTSLWIGQVELTFERKDAVRVSLLPFVLFFLAVFCCGVPVLVYRNLPTPSVELVCDVSASYLISLPEEKPQAVVENPLEATPVLSDTEPLTDTVTISETVTISDVVDLSPPSHNTAIYDTALQAYTSENFLELPIPYTGSNQFGVTQDEFAAISQSVYSGGRINSFFDHDLPIYPSYNNNGRETVDQTNYLLLFNGQQVKDRDTWKTADGYFYSGHPAYDFSGSGSTPIFAAATGVVLDARKASCEGNVVRIEHTVQNIGNFQTSYFHLQDDKYFQSLLQQFQEGGEQKLSITEGTRIGTMGTTGTCTTGIHLHFEVRFDKNNDGHFDSGEVVDPYGYIPSLEFPKDTWSTKSLYLWRHPLGTTFTQTRGGRTTGLNKTTLPETEEISREQPELCVPHAEISQDGPVYFSLSLSPPPAQGLVSVAQAITFIILDSEQEVVPQYKEEVLVSLPYGEADLKNIVPGSLSIRRLNTEKGEWEYIPTKFDTTKKIAAASVNLPGQYALLGELKPDHTPPITTISLTGMINADESAWCDAVEVSFSSTDDRGAVKDLSYHLRDDLPWEPSPGPDRALTIQAIPASFHIQAKAIDQSDNPEDPPAALSFVINPQPLSLCHSKEITSIPVQQKPPLNPLYYYLPILLLTGIVVWLLIKRRSSRK